MHHDGVYRRAERPWVCWTGPRADLRVPHPGAKCRTPCSLPGIPGPRCFAVYVAQYLVVILTNMTVIRAVDPIFINVHGGNDYFTTEMGHEYFSRVLEVQKKLGAFPMMI